MGRLAFIPILLVFGLFLVECRHVQRPQRPKLPVLSFQHHQPVPAAMVDLNGSESSGIRLYENNCQFCHGLLSESTKAGRSKASIQAAIAQVPEMQSIQLTDAEVAAIARVLGLPPSLDRFACDAQTALPTLTPDVIRPLSKSQYSNTLKTLFGSYQVLDSVAIDIAGIPNIENKIDPFDNINLTLGDSHVFSYTGIASKLSDTLVSQSQFIQDAFGQDSCVNTADLSSDCIQTFAKSFGLRILRRPLDAQDSSRALKLVGPETTAKEEAAMILYSWLISSDFLYQLYTNGMRSNTDGKVIELSSYELANRLAYGLWSTMPDPELYKLAADGSLKKAEIMEAQVDRMLADPKAQLANGQFYVQWLQLKNSNGFNIPDQLLNGLRPEEAFKAEITTESADFVNSISFAGKGGYAELLLSPQTFAQTMTYKTILGTPKPEERPGLLWRLVLASSNFSSHRNIIHSGAIIREKILCEPLPLPSAKLTEAVSAAAKLNLDELSSRQEVTQKTQASSCAVCHAKINPLSFAGANHYDAMGRFIDFETKVQSDGSLKKFAIDGAIADPFIDRPGEAGLDGPYALALAISKSKKGPACLIKKRYTAIMGRPAQEEGNLDGCVLKRAYEALQKPGEGQLLGMLKAYFGPEMRYRRLTN